MRPRQASLLTSAVDPSGYPAAGAPEIAFAGRSNVGKSSLINALLGRRKLAKVSQTPGKTRLLNFFSVEQDRLRLVDLPGYGYAQVSQAERASWRRMIERYLKERESLSAVVLLADARRGLQQWEQDLLQWLSGLGIAWVLVFTKIDKLKRREIEALSREISGATGLLPGDFLLTSAVRGAGLPELWKRIELLAFPPQSA